MSVCIATRKPNLRRITRGYFEKTWSTKADWESGILDKLYCPIGLNQMELEYDELLGTGTFIFNPGANLRANWIYFNATFESDYTKTIFRDDFRADSLAKYDIVGASPTYDAANHRLSCMSPPDGASGLYLPASISLKNLKAQCDFYFTGKIAGEGGPSEHIECRWSYPPRNGYYFQHVGTGSGNATSIWKRVDGEGTILTTADWKVPWNVWRTHYVELNDSSLKSYTDEGSMSATDGSITTANKIKMYHLFANGYMDNILVEHYTLPDPPNATQTVIFWTSDNGEDWDGPYNEIADCPDSRYLKWQVTLARDDLDSAMPVVHDHTLGYFMKGS